MAIVNVNIKNCNCCGGSSDGGSSSGGGSSGNDLFESEPASSVDDPPQGFSSSAVDDRACKVAIWLYDWVASWLDILESQAWLLNWVVSILATRAGKSVLLPPLKKALSYIAGLVAAAIGTPGLTPDDPLTATIAAVMAEKLIEEGISDLTSASLNQGKTILQQKRSEFICNISRHGTPYKSQVEFLKWATITFPLNVAKIIHSSCLIFFNLLYYSADWWPAFESELEGITETCCAGLTDGTPIETGSAQACAGANFILDNLVGCLTTADSYVQEYSRTTYNSVTASESIILNNVQSGFSVPGNVQNKAWSFPLMQAELARYIYAKLGGDSWLTPGIGVNTWEMGRLGAHLQSEIAICELRDCETAQAAYELLAGAIDAWLSANVTDQALVNHVRLFCQGLIHPAGAYIGVLFAESADLAGFAGTSDCSECDECLWDFAENPNFAFVNGKRIGSPVWVDSANVSSYNWDSVGERLYVSIAAGSYAGGYFEVDGCGIPGKVWQADSLIRCTFSGHTTNCRGYLYILFSDGTTAYNGGENGTWGVSGSYYSGKIVSGVYLAAEGTAAGTIYFDNLEIQ